MLFRSKVKILAKCVVGDRYLLEGNGWVSRNTIELDKTVSKEDAEKYIIDNKKADDFTKSISTVNPVNTIAYDIGELLVEEAGAINGMPYQFMEDVDSRLSDKVAFGNMYIDRIVSKMPLLLLSPGLPDFLPSYNKSERSIITSALVGLAGGSSSIADNIEQLLSSENGRYYAFKYEYAGYYYNVNKLCRFGAVSLGIQDVIHKCNGATRNYNSLGNMAWQDQVGKSLKGFINSQEYVAFYLDSETSISESFGNSTTSSQIAGSFNSMSEMSRELQFLAGPVAGLKVNASNPSLSLSFNLSRSLLPFSFS